LKGIFAQINTNIVKLRNVEYLIYICTQNKIMKRVCTFYIQENEHTSSI